MDATLTISAEWSSQLFKTTTTSKSLFAANNQVCCAKAESSVGRRSASFLAGTATTGRNKKVLESIRNKTERSQILFQGSQQRMLRGVPAYMTTTNLDAPIQLFRKSPIAFVTMPV